MKYVLISKQCSDLVINQDVILLSVSFSIFSTQRKRLPFPAGSSHFYKEQQELGFMSLFPNEDTLTKEIESWKGFADSLQSQEYKELFNKMLNDCYKYAIAINAKGEPFPAEPLLMSLLLSQHKMIEWLTDNSSTAFERLLRHGRKYPLHG